MDYIFKPLSSKIESRRLFIDCQLPSRYVGVTMFSQNEILENYELTIGF